MGALLGFTVPHILLRSTAALLRPAPQMKIADRRSVPIAQLRAELQGGSLLKPSVEEPQSCKGLTRFDQSKWKYTSSHQIEMTVIPCPRLKKYKQPLKRATKNGTGSLLSHVSNFSIDLSEERSGP